MTVNRCGFTLIELIVTLCLIGIIAGISGPGIMKAIPGISLKSAAYDLAGDIRLARSLAVKNQVVTKIVFITTQPGSYTLSVNGNDVKNVNLGNLRGGVKLGVGSATVSAAKTSKAFPANFDFCSNKTITFSPNGMSTVGSFGYKYLCNQNNDMSYAIGLTSLAGIVSIRKIDGGNSWTSL